MHKTSKEMEGVREGRRESQMGEMERKKQRDMKRV